MKSRSRTPQCCEFVWFRTRRVDGGFSRSKLMYTEVTVFHVHQGPERLSAPFMREIEIEREREREPLKEREREPLKERDKESR
jgi:hypothetical protein